MPSQATSCRSCDLVTFKPKEAKKWQEALKRFEKVCANYQMLRRMKGLAECGSPAMMEQK